jgi:GH24 family phage-related lysozyme (muramidase)
MHISEAGLRLIEGFEGFSSAPYWDAYGGVWTRGFGETEGITGHTAAISYAHAHARLRTLIESRYEPAVKLLGVELNQNQFDALCSFVWNLGPGIFTGELREALEQRRWTLAAHLMQAYDHAGGQVLEGLRRRREAEAQLFLTAPRPYVPADEARWERQYDRLLRRKGPWPAVRRRVLRRVMTARRREIWRLAKPKGPAGWDELNRRARYEALLARTE